MSQVAAQHSSQGHAGSAAGSAVHAAEPRDVEASSNGALPQGFFEVYMVKVVSMLSGVLHSRQGELT